MTTTAPHSDETPATAEEAPEEFRGCARPCWSVLEHTYAHGSCTQASNPPGPDAAFEFLGPITRVNGVIKAEAREIHLFTLLPWTRHLPYRERWAMLDEIAASDDPAETFRSWKATAYVWANRELLDTLSGPFDTSNYEEVTRPHEHRDDEGLKIYTDWTVPIREGEQRVQLRRTGGGDARLTIRWGNRASVLLNHDRATVLIAGLQDYVHDLEQEWEAEDGQEAQKLIVKE